MDNKIPLSKTKQEHHEFLPAVLEVLETPPVKFGRIIAITIICFLVLSIIWASIGKIDVVAISEGRIIPAGNIKIIQPLETGVVRKIYVQDADTVKQGDLLLELDPTESLANLDSLNIDLQQAKIDATIGFALLQKNPIESFNQINELNNEFRETAKNQVLEEYRKYHSAIQALNLEIKRFKSTKRIAEIDRKKIIQVIPFIESQLDGQQILLKQEMTERVTVEDLQQKVIEHKASLLMTQETINEAQASIEVNKARIEELTANFRSQANRQRRNALRQIALIEKNILKVKQQLSYLMLKAPVDGVVQQLNIHTIGGVVNSAEPLMVIVPQNTLLEIESMILNKDIGFVDVGQSVEIKIESFPFTRYGTLTGELISISHDAIIHEQLGPVYKAKVKLNNQHIVIGSKKIGLSPGMKVSVEIKTGDRKIIEFFLSPLLRYKDEAFRER